MIKKIAQASVIFFASCCSLVNSEPLYTNNIIDSLKDSDHDGVIDARDACENTKVGSDIDHHGCPAIKLEFLTFEFDVQFDTAEYQLKPKFHKRLEDLALFLEKYPESVILIEGHTDNEGPSHYNQTLSKKRAQSIAETLNDKFGIQTNRTKAFGYGQDRPIASNLTDTGKEKNRRVSGEVITLQAYPTLIDKALLTVPFDLSKEEIISIIDDLGPFLTNNPESLVIIEGHTDDIGGKRSNERLSEKQATKIAEGLSFKYSIPLARMKVVGHGQDFPIASNDTFEGRYKNRRIDITVATRFKPHKEVALKKWSIWNIENNH